MKEEKKTIKINPERREQIKKSLGLQGKLGIPDDLREEGYHYRWVSSEKPYRLHQLETLGYSKVTNKQNKPYTIYGGVGERGNQYELHLYKIPSEAKEEIDAVKAEERWSRRQAKINELGGLKTEEVYTKEGKGDLSSLEQKIKKL